MQTMPFVGTRNAPRLSAASTQRELGPALGRKGGSVPSLSLDSPKNCATWFIAKRRQGRRGKYRQFSLSVLSTNPFLNDESHHGSSDSTVILPDSLRFAKVSIGHGSKCTYCNAVQFKSPPVVVKSTGLTLYACALSVDFTED